MEAVIGTYISIQIIAKPCRIGTWRSCDPRIFCQNQKAFRAGYAAVIVAGKRRAVACHIPETCGIQAPRHAELSLAHYDLATSAGCLNDSPTRSRSSKCATNNGCKDSKGCEEHV